jgi:hypothetical protein
VVPKLYLKERFKVDIRDSGYSDEITVDHRCAFRFLIEYPAFNR